MSLEPDYTRPQPTGGPGVTRFALRGNHRLSYESSGVPDGIPVLALHDLLADRGQLRALEEAPYDATFRVTLPDARGHGASAMLSGRRYPSQELATDAFAVLDAEGLATLHLAAFGWGAVTALACAVVAPERVNSLVLAAPYVPMLLAANTNMAAHQVGRAHLETIQQVATAAEKGQTERALDVLLGARMGADWRDRFTKPRLGAVRRAAGNLAPLLMGMAEDTTDWGVLKRVHVPVTLLIGHDPTPLDRGTVDALVSLMPHSRTASVSPTRPGQPISESEWTDTIARALLMHAVQQEAPDER